MQAQDKNDIDVIIVGSGPGGATVAKELSRAKKILKNAGAKGIFKTGYLAAHPGGTVKVGQLVDSNLKTEYDNLYVCDCSIIPEAWGLPPTSTIIGLGKRLAKYLLGAKHIADNQQRETPVPDEMDQPALVH